MRSWFAQTILYSQSFSLTGQYMPFGQLGQSVLEMQAALASVSLTKADKEAFSALMQTLPAHQDVRQALEELKAAGFSLCTLTNNSMEVQNAQLEHAGLASLFDRTFSVDEGAKAFKPAIETYRYVEREAGSDNRFCLVACHTWDVIGAKAADWDAALIRRPHNAPLTVGLQPDFDCFDMTDFSRAVIAAYP
ncbi:HAD-IA family hydrolase [Pantoea sp. LMR881]|uniref:HAD-IA family hydrolase n=1 Tax=Pantoea sp. LMR881 TaxID=3014336 RepID=UPI0022B024C1|nr:HAD-IA family hydrolase [Pantoea sp. LMR881]MCZ4058539.1 HAD-IA family hydrolase [Pantoea sp. LMR881]